MAVGRDLVQREIVKAFGDRAAPVGPVAGEIVQCHRPAMRRGMGDHGLGQIALIESAALGFGDAPEGAGQRGVAEPLTGEGRAADGHKGLGKAGLITQKPPAPRPKLGNDRADGETLFGIADRGLKEIGKGQLAETFGNLDPSRNGAGNGHGIPAVEGHGIETRKAFGCPALWRAARGVEAVQLVPVPQDRESI